MNWDAIGTTEQKIALVAIVILVGFVISKLVANILVDVTIWSNTGTRRHSGDPDAQERSDEPTDDVPGLHVLTDYEAQQILVDKNPTEDVIRATIRSLDWHEGFHRVLLVTSPGVSLEVSGSLDPDYGLSSTHRDLNNSIIRSIKEPPISVAHLEDLLVSFHLGDGRWEKTNEYEWSPL